MDKVYRRINWNTMTSNGHANTHQYLSSQIARAICLAAYEKPATVEEISISTGIPAMYIEDELPHLEYGDAVYKVGNKYVANFIIFRLKDRKKTEEVSSAVVNLIADKMEVLLKGAAKEVEQMDFYGHSFGMERLGYIAVPYLLRKTLRNVKSNRLKLESGPYPPRKDGGYGWFIVEETADETETVAEYNCGCNVAEEKDSGEDQPPSRIYYYWISKYFDSNVYHNKGTRWMCESGILRNSKSGEFSKDALSREDAAHLIASNLLSKSDKGYALEFPCFKEEQFAEFASLFDMTDEVTEDLLTEWIKNVRKSFEEFVPKHLNDQINQWVSCYLQQITGYVIDELIRRGVLCKPNPEKPLTSGVFCVEGKGITP